MSGDTTVKKVERRGTRGRQGQIYLASGKRVPMGMWRDERPTDAQPAATRE